MNESTSQYNKRLFNPKNIRGRLHLARYLWLESLLKKKVDKPITMLELGCFDGKTLEYLPIEVTKYDGYDANWEGGLDEGMERYKDKPNYQFHESKTVEGFNPNDEKYDVVVCQETMEHLPTVDLNRFAQKLALATKEYAFVSVPNEMGIVLVLKYWIKRYFQGYKSTTYSSSELWNGFLNRMDKVEREEGGHKGFSYVNLRKILEQYFEIESIEGIPFKLLGPRFSFTVGMVLRPKKD